MKFGDVIICVASIAVIFALILLPLDLLFVAALGLKPGYDLGPIVSLFLSPLIGGYILAEKLREDKRQSITKIAVLWAALNMLIALIVPAGLANWGQKVREEYLATNPGATLSTAEWVNVEMMFQDLVMFMIVIEALVLGFIGLYIGSMLRKPKKS